MKKCNLNDEVKVFIGALIGEITYHYVIEPTRKKLKERKAKKKEEK